MRDSSSIMRDSVYSIAIDILLASAVNCHIVCRTSSYLSLNSPTSQRSYFEIDHLHNQAGRGHFDDLIHLHCAVGQPLAVALLELQNPRNDHIDAAKIPARRLMDLLDHFIGHFLVKRVT